MNANRDGEASDILFALIIALPDNCGSQTRPREFSETTCKKKRQIHLERLFIFLAIHRRKNVVGAQCRINRTRVPTTPCIISRRKIFIVGNVRGKSFYERTAGER